MFKKLLLILFLSLFIITGCTKKEDNDTLKFASWGSKSEVEIIKARLDEFQKIHPEIKVEFVHIPQNYFQKLHLLLASDLAPDVVFINNLNIPVYEKYLLNLNHLVSENDDDYYPQVLDTMSYQGRLLAIPRDVSTLAVFYNKDMFDKYGIPYPNKDWSIEDLLTTSQKFKENDVFGISFEEQNLFYLPYLRAFNGGILNENNELIIDTENSKNGINFYADLRNKHNVAPKSHQSASETMAQMFLNERLAMHLTGHWLVPKYRESANFDWDVINFPNTNGKSSVTLDASGYGIIKSTKKQAEAIKLVQFLTSEESSKEFTKTGLIIPARTSIMESDTFLSGQKPKNSSIFSEIIKTSDKTPVNKNYKEITDKIDEKLNYVFN